MPRYFILWLESSPSLCISTTKDLIFPAWHSTSFLVVFLLSSYLGWVCCQRDLSQCNSVLPCSSDEHLVWHLKFWLLADTHLQPLPHIWIFPNCWIQSHVLFAAFTHDRNACLFHGFVGGGRGEVEKGSLLQNLSHIPLLAWPSCCLPWSTDTHSSAELWVDITSLLYKSFRFTCLLFSGWTFSILHGKFLELYF